MKKFMKIDIINDNRINSNDTGSAEVQIALLTSRINYITEHLKKFNKDKHTKNGLIKMVCKRRKLLKYLKRKDLKSYSKIVVKLEIKKI